MIEEISLLMPQLATYSTLFPGKKALDNCLRILISDFVGFCIEAVIFFKRWPICKLSMALSRILILHMTNWMGKTLCSEYSGSHLNVTSRPISRTYFGIRVNLTGKGKSLLTLS